MKHGRNKKVRKSRNLTCFEFAYISFSIVIALNNYNDNFAVEYAQKAVDNGGTMIAIRGKDGVVTAVDKLITSKLYVEVSLYIVQKSFFFFGNLEFNHSVFSVLKSYYL